MKNVSMNTYKQTNKTKINVSKIASFILLLVICFIWVLYKQAWFVFNNEVLL